MARRLTKRQLTAPLGRGLRTPEEKYRRPILEALAALGGRAAAGDVLSRVEMKMKSQLTEHDYAPLPSNPKEPRWRNAARWCRNTLVREGLLKADFTPGIWELSASGKEALRSGQVEKPATG